MDTVLQLSGVRTVHMPRVFTEFHTHPGTDAVFCIFFSDAHCEHSPVNILSKSVTCLWNTFTISFVNSATHLALHHLLPTKCTGTRVTKIFGTASHDPQHYKMDLQKRPTDTKLPVLPRQQTQSRVKSTCRDLADEMPVNASVNCETAPHQFEAGWITANISCPVTSTPLTCLLSRSLAYHR